MRNDSLDGHEEIFVEQVFRQLFASASRISVVSSLLSLIPAALFVLAVFVRNSDML